MPVLAKIRFFLALLSWLLYYFSMDNAVYCTRLHEDKAADQDEIKRFEKTALSNFNRGKKVFLIEQFPKQFWYFATKIRLEKVEQPVATLSAVSNSRLFKVISTNSIYE